MFQSLVPIILCVLPEATMSAKPCCVSRLSSDVCGDFIVANIEDEYSAFTLVGIQWKLQYTVAVDKTSFYLFSYFSFSTKSVCCPLTCGRLTDCSSHT